MIIFKGSFEEGLFHTFSFIIEITAFPGFRIHEKKRVKILTSIMKTDGLHLSVSKEFSFTKFLLQDYLECVAGLKREKIHVPLHRFINGTSPALRSLRAK